MVNFLSRVARELPERGVSMPPLLRDNSPSAPIAAGTIDRWESLSAGDLGDEDRLSLPWRGVPLAMWEDDGHIHVEAELPGLMEEDVGVTVHNGRLFIRGERRPEGTAGVCGTVGLTAGSNGSSPSRQTSTPRVPGPS